MTKSGITSDLHVQQVWISAEQITLNIKRLHIAAAAAASIVQDHLIKRTISNEQPYLSDSKMSIMKRRPQ